MSIVLNTNFPELKLIHRGKVRDIFDLGDYLLFVATDRISAFDVVFNEGIPLKGKVLTSLSLFWFNRLSEICENHLVTSDISGYPEECKKYAEILDGRSMLVKKVKIFPVEFIVRGYITGSAWSEYVKSKSICGIKLPDGLAESEKLPEPLFTPTTKEAVGKHDENITFDEFIKITGEETAYKLKNKAVEIYLKASEYAQSKGIIIADTKFEFGVADNKIILADEVLTPDSSRFWKSEFYEKGKPQQSFDKQILRNYLISIGFNKQPPPPPLPEEIIRKTSEKYLEILNILTS